MAGLAIDKDFLLDFAKLESSVQARVSEVFEKFESNDQNLWIPGGRAFPEDDLQGT